MAREEEGVMAREEEGVMAREEEAVMAREEEGVMAREEEGVMAREEEGVMAREEEGVMAREEEGVMAREEEGVMAREEEGVMAKEEEGVMVREEEGEMAREEEGVMASKGVDSLVPHSPPPPPAHSPSSHACTSPPLHPQPRQPPPTLSPPSAEAVMTETSGAVAAEGAIDVAGMTGESVQAVPDGADPETYKNMRYFKKHTDIEDIYREWDNIVSEEEAPILEEIVRNLAALAPETQREFETALSQQRKAYKISFRKAQLLLTYQRLTRGAKTLPPSPALARHLVKKSSKSQSGVLVITVLTSPYPSVNGVVQKFSCAWDCHYCPSEPSQPKSYLHEEPAVKRANENNFDAVLQLTDRAATLAMNGHPVDKIECLVLGGTWASYPHAYQEEFCRDLFYAANTFWQRAKRERRSLAEEQAINERSECKIIGLTLETRPDTIDAAELRRMRRYGCTRVQLGVQHTDDAILKKINRASTTADTVAALRLLKDSCFKVDIHLMPNLPGASVEADEAMFERVLSDEALQADQWKIYPCQVVPWTVIKRWFDRGEYVPYEMHDLFELLMRVKAKVHPWIRLNRVVRDIPLQYVSGGVDVPNLREDLVATMARRGTRCRCIRCREVGGAAQQLGAPRLTARAYASSGGTEIFLSFETADQHHLFGFLRLRLPGEGGGARHGGGGGASRRRRRGGGEEEAPPFPELRGAALVRELHVYGQLISTADKEASDAQHSGLGRRLMDEAERRARAQGLLRVAVIAGVGSRGYYAKLGYHLEGEGLFMIKTLSYFAPGWHTGQQLPRLQFVPIIFPAVRDVPTTPP
ncbi:hypothetical protein AB1Y20_004638 [Prymnesium parvum]|uniref:tRNA carboxymethyluridine synthase n=1 Tax=Prymnesium parvum TaxID=97485 RepID=A0AB34IYR7_PRYPA